MFQPIHIQSPAISFRAPQCTLQQEATFADKIFTFPQKIYEALRGRFTVIPSLKAELRQSVNQSEVILRILQGPYKEQLLQDLQQVVTALPRDVKEALLKTAAEKGITQITEVIVLEDLVSLISRNNPSLPSFEEIAKRMIALAEEKYPPEIPPIVIKKQHPFIESCIILLQTLRLACGMLETGKEPDSYFEADYLLGIFVKIVLIPASLISLLNLILPTAASLAIVGIALFLLYLGINCIPDGIKLPQHCQNLTQEVREGKIPTIYGRDKEAKNLAENLISKAPRKPLLKGNSGVGKTTIAKRLAQGIVNGEYPELAGKEVLLVNTADLIPPEMADHLARKPFEKLLNALGSKTANTIIFFDDLQGAFKREGVLSDQLKNKMTQYYFGALTQEDFNKMDAGLKTRFGTEIDIGNLSEEGTLYILSRYVEREAPEYEFSPKVLKKIYDESLTKKSEQPQEALDALSKLVVKIRSTKKEKEKIFEKENFNLFDIRFLQSEKAAAFQTDFVRTKTILEENLQKEKNMKQNLQSYGEYKKYLAQTRSTMLRLARKGLSTAESTKNFAFNLFFIEPLISEKIKLLSKDNALHNFVDINDKNEITY